MKKIILMTIFILLLINTALFIWNVLSLSYIISECITFCVFILSLFIAEKKPLILDWFFIEDKKSTQLIDTGIISGNIIKSFAGDFAFLSNSYKCRFIIDDIIYTDVEHYYYACKPASHLIKEKIINTNNLSKIFDISKKCVIRADWESIKYSIMRTAIASKFLQSKELKMRLIATKGFMLQNGNFNNDELWGINLHNNKGQNMLGKIIMDLRDKL